MTEAEWLACEDPRKQVEGVRAIVSARKLRLFACAFWRGWWHAETEHHSATELDFNIVQLLAYSEQWAERGPRPEGSLPGGFGWHPLVARNAADAANWTIRQTAGYKARG